MPLVFPPFSPFCPRWVSRRCTPPRLNARRHICFVTSSWLVLMRLPCWHCTVSGVHVCVESVQALRNTRCRNERKKEHMRKRIFQKKIIDWFHLACRHVRPPIGVYPEVYLVVCTVHDEHALFAPNVVLLLPVVLRMEPRHLRWLGVHAAGDGTVDNAECFLLKG